MLKRLSRQETFTADELLVELREQYGEQVNRTSLENAVSVLQGGFVSKEEERRKFEAIEILKADAEAGRFERMKSYEVRLEHPVFAAHVRDLVQVGLHRYQDICGSTKQKEGPFVLYEK